MIYWLLFKKIYYRIYVIDKYRNFQKTVNTIFKFEIPTTFRFAFIYGMKITTKCKLKIQKIIQLDINL